MRQWSHVGSLGLLFFAASPTPVLPAWPGGFSLLPTSALPPPQDLTRAPLQAFPHSSLFLLRTGRQPSAPLQDGGGEGSASPPTAQAHLQKGNRKQASRCRSWSSAPRPPPSRRSLLGSRGDPGQAAREPPHVERGGPGCPIVLEPRQPLALGSDPRAAGCTGSGGLQTPSPGL